MDTEQKEKRAADKRHYKRMVERAAILSIMPAGENCWRVWGGEHDHFVTVEGELVKCDCEGWRHARYRICSHVMKYRLTYGDLRKGKR